MLHSLLPSSSASLTSSRASIHPRAIDNLPPKSHDNMTRFVLLSDTHTHTFPVPDGDVLLHAGDLTERGSVKELKVTIDWLCSLPHKYKIIIAGNHDYCLDEEILKESMDDGHQFYLQADLIHSTKAKEAGLIYLQDSMVEIPIAESSSLNDTSDKSNNTNVKRKTWKIFGSPWSAAFCSMAFNIPRGGASEELYAQIPESTDILLTHGPPLGMLDRIKHGNRNVGCDALLSRLQTGLPNLRLHIWGHIHEDRGVIIDEEGSYGKNAIRDGDEMDSSDQKGGKRKGTVFVNAANAGTFERPRRLWGEGKYQPIVVDLVND